MERLYQKRIARLEAERDDAADMRLPAQSQGSAPLRPGLSQERLPRQTHVMLPAALAAASQVAQRA